MRRPRIIKAGIAGIREEMSLIGVDPVGIGIMEGKSRHLLIRVDEVDLRAALILKQNLLSLGGEAALLGFVMPGALGWSGILLTMLGLILYIKVQSRG